MLNLIYNESSKTVNDHFSEVFGTRSSAGKIEKIVGGSIIGASFF